MSFGIWQRTITDDAGNVLPGATIEVRTPSADFTGALVSLFSNEAGSTGLANPFNADSEGFAQFYAAPRKVDIRATGSGSQRTWRNVEILGTAATANVQTSPTDTTAGRLMAVGAGGLLGSTLTVDYNSNTAKTSFINGDAVENIPTFTAGIQIERLGSPLRSAQMLFDTSGGSGKPRALLRKASDGSYVGVDAVELYHTGNTIVDSNGFIKEA